MITIKNASNGATVARFEEIPDELKQLTPVSTGEGCASYDLRDLYVETETGTVYTVPELKALYEETEQPDYMNFQYFMDCATDPTGSLRPLESYLAFWSE